MNFEMCHLFRTSIPQGNDHSPESQYKSLRPILVKHMLDADRRLTVRPMSEDLDIFTFTGHKNIIIKKTRL